MLARGAILLAIVLRCLLNEVHIKPERLRLLIHLLNTYFEKFKFARCENFKAAEWPVVAAWLFAQSVRCVCGPYSPARVNLLY